MRNAYLVLLLFSFCLFSCHKDKPIVKTYKVTLNATGFTQQIIAASKNKPRVAGFGNDAATADSYLKKLVYIVYDSSGNQVHYLQQDSTSSNIGVIQDYLPAGTYKVYIMAGGPGFTNDYDGPNVILDYSGGPWKDTFYATGTVTVNGDVNQSITLNRVVAELEVEIQDALPAGSTSMSVAVSTEYFKYEPALTPAPTTPGALTLPFTIPASAVGTTNTIYSGFICNTISPFNVTITCYDASKNVLGTATVSNVTCQINKKTILQGKLFGSSVGFNFTLNPMLPTPINLPF